MTDKLGQSVGDDARGSRERRDRDDLAGDAPARQSGASTDVRLGHDANDSRACQIPDRHHTALSVPWSGDDRAGDKTELFKYVVSNREGTPLPMLVRSVFDEDSVDAGGGDYQLARRFVRDCKYVKTDRRDGLLWCFPTVEALHLSRQYANGKTSGRRGGDVSNVPNWRETGEHRDDLAGDDCGTDGDDGLPGDGDTADCRSSGTNRTPQYPKDRAQSVLEDNVVFDGSDGRHDYRDELLRELGVERENQQDRFKVLRRVRGTGNSHLLVPYLTRFNSVERATSVRSGFETALDTAADAHDDAVVMTLTTDPDRFDCLSDAVSNLYDAKSRLLSWLATDYKLGSRPDNLTVLEFTESGLPHVHVVLFGLNWAVPQSTLSAKWDDLGQGNVVDIRSARRRGDDWLLHNDDGGTATLRQYLGKAIRGLQTLAETDVGDVREAAESGDVSLWKQTLYWATERQYYSCSPSLKDTDDGGLPHVTVWEFVGVAEYRNIPGHIRENARVLRRGQPPPDGRDGGQSDTSTATGQ